MRDQNQTSMVDEEREKDFFHIYTSGRWPMAVTDRRKMNSDKYTYQLLKLQSSQKKFKLHYVSNNSTSSSSHY
jgi:hypothetical protein